MFPAVVGCAQAGSGPAALSVSLSATVTQIGVDVSNFEFDYTGAHGVVTGSGEADSTATGAGGDGSYSYAWVVTETADSPGLNPQTGTGPSCSLTTAGTQNAAQYNSARWTVLQPAIEIAGGGGPTGDDPFDAGIYRLRCTVTDGTSATATADYTVRVLPV